MLSTDQWIDVVIPIVVTIIATVGAFLLTRWYQDKTKNKDIELQKRQKKSEWILANARIYISMSAMCKVLRNRLESPTPDVLSVFYHLLYFVQLVKELTAEMSMYYFDDLEAEAFAEFMTRKTFQKVVEAFDNDFVKASQFRELIPKNGSLAQLQKALDGDPSKRALYDMFNKWIAQKENTNSLNKLVFVLGNVLEFEINKMLLTTYANEDKIKEALRSRFNPKLELMKGLPQAIEEFNKQLEEESGLRLTMYQNENLNI